MKKLLSIPQKLVESIYKLENLNREEWFCTADPEDSKLGSGSGTTWLLEACYNSEHSQLDFKEWIKKEKRILLHACGQSSRLPSYAPVGKVLTPIPVFRWSRGQYLNQKLIDLQIPLYENILKEAPDSLNTLIASGDVLITLDDSMPAIPEVDIVCFSVWADPSVAQNHGVFVSNRKTPDVLDFMLQKPSYDKLNTIATTHLFSMDIGVWLLSDKAVNILRNMSYDVNDHLTFYDLYSDFGACLGNKPLTNHSDINSLSVAIVPLDNGSFYHYGTSADLIASTLNIQNKELDQRKILHNKIKTHPAIFVQNAELQINLTNENANVWVENSYITEDWRIENNHIITGIPLNNWAISLKAGQCVDIVPVGDNMWIARPYGFTDTFKDCGYDSAYMTQSFGEWISDRKLSEDLFDLSSSLQNQKIFPIVSSLNDLYQVLIWMLEPVLVQGREIWINSEKVSAKEISDCINFDRLYKQRDALFQRSLYSMEKNANNSVFYQTDLLELSSYCTKHSMTVPDLLSNDNSILLRMHNAMFRAKQLADKGSKDMSLAHSLMQQGLSELNISANQTPKLGVHLDQIVWARSPIRIDLAGGWTDTPPYSIYEGGAVINIAVELNDQPPIQVYIKCRSDFNIILRSIDLGAEELISDYDGLSDYNKIGSPFSIPKAALALTGFNKYAGFKTLNEQLQAFGVGLEISLLSAIPAGSGLGTSSVLASAVLGALNEFCELKWDKNKVGFNTLLLEQMLTTGGGWQDQFGGLFHGVKHLKTNKGFAQFPQVNWLPEYVFTNPQYESCHLLYYTGITRTAKNILSEIVSNMFLNSKRHLDILQEMKYNVLKTKDAIQKGDFIGLADCVLRSWNQKKALDPGTNPPEVEYLIELVKDLCLGYTLPGAGGGGYLYMIAKDRASASLIKERLTNYNKNPRARFVKMSLSQTGLQISKS